MTFSNSNDHHRRYLGEIQQKTTGKGGYKANKVSGDR
jgi:hypothetical protein